MTSIEKHQSPVHTGTGEGLPERFDDPGLPPHEPRRGDLDPAADKTSERIVLALFGLSTLGTIGFLVAYFALPTGQDAATIQRSNMALGLALACALLGIGAAAIHWAKSIMNNHERVEDRHSVASSPEVREAAVANLVAGAQDSGISRRGLLKSALVGSLALFPLTIVVPLVGEVGENWDVASFKRTLWRKGLRLTTDPSGRPIKAADVTVGSIWHVIPEGLEEAPHPLDEKAKAVVIVMRLEPDALIEAPERKDWSHEGIVAYSKICTHVGCPVALYEKDSHHLLCPCHQSTFDVADDCRVVFGPAKRPLPQLPITVDSTGRMRANGSFDQAVGPGFWERP